MPPPPTATATATVHLTTGLPGARLSRLRLGLTLLAHIALLALAAIWVISSSTPPAAPESLVFTSERPSSTANGKKSEHAAKLARKKNTGGAPPNARRLTSSVSKSISLPAIPSSSIHDFQPGRMGGGMGSGLGGFGTGAGPGSGGLGMGQGGGRIKFFGFETDASSVVLAIDTSGSMTGAVGGPSGIAKLQDEINRTIQSLSPASLFNIICFGQDADAAFPANVLATSDNKLAAIKFMEGYYGQGAFGRTRTEKLRELNQPVNVELAQLNGIPFTPLTVETVKGLEGTSGGSRMDLALVAAMERKATSIFLLSDGQPSAMRGGRTLDQNELISVIRDHHKSLYKGKPLVINTIYTNTNRSEEAFMKKISRQFGGQHKDVQFD